MSKFFKALFGTASLVEIARKIITITVLIAFSIPGISAIITKQVSKIVQTEMAPISAYVSGDMVKLINKNFDKIIKDPADVKLIDIESCLSYWDILKETEISNKALLQQKVDKLQDWYISEIEGKNEN